MVEELYSWDREDKLFAIRALKQVPPERRARLLKTLVVDDDPVVRGKAALALKGGPEDVIMDVARTLIEQQSPETSILAAELLGFIEATDAAEPLETLIRSEDDRVAKAALGSLDGLPPETILELLDVALDRYRPAFDTALERFMTRAGRARFLPVLKQWYDRTGEEQKPIILCMAAGWDDEARSWVRERITALELTDRQETLLQWILEPDEPED